MGIFTFFLVIGVIPGLPAGALVGRWALVAVVAAVLFMRRDITPGGYILLAYLAVMTFFAPVWWDSTFLFFHAVCFVILYSYAQGMVSLRNMTIGMGLGMAVNSAVVLAQFIWDWKFVPTITPYAGLYFQRNIGAETAAVSLILLVGYRLWWLIPGCLPTLFFGSRAAAVAVAVPLAMMLWRRSKIIAAATFASLISAICIAWLITNYFMAGKIVPTATLFASDLVIRLHTWYDALHGLTWFGRGLGSFMVEFPRWQDYTSALQLRWENAHNDPLQIVFELGIGGVVLIALFAIRLSYAERRPEFYALIAVVVEGMFGFPLYQPVTGPVAALCAGWLFGHGDPLRDVLVRFGLRILTWYETAKLWAFRARRRTIPVLSRAPAGGSLVYHQFARRGGYSDGGGGNSDGSLCPGPQIGPVAPSLERRAER